MDPSTPRRKYRKYLGSVLSPPQESSSDVPRKTLYNWKLRDQSQHELDENPLPSTSLSPAVHTHCNPELAKNLESYDNFMEEIGCSPPELEDREREENNTNFDVGSFQNCDWFRKSSTLCNEDLTSGCGDEEIQSEEEHVLEHDLYIVGDADHLLKDDVIEAELDLDDELQPVAELEQIDRPNLNEDVYANPLLQDELLDEPLYADAEITLRESVTSILTFSLKAGLTSVALTGLLDLLTILLPKSSILPGTKYLFRKIFNECEGSHQMKFYCPDCNASLDNENLQYHCRHCIKAFTKKRLEENGNFFLYMPVAEQLKRLLSNPDVIANIDYKHTRIAQPGFSDIYDGDVYRRNEKYMQGNNMTISLSTDGVPLFKSSNFSLWPLQVILNDLPPNLRKKSVIVAGLWFGSNKPNINTFLAPFIDECQSFSTVGINWMKDGQFINSKVFVTCCAADSPARCMLQNIKQFNGEYGCSWCLHSGLQLQPGHRVYPSRVSISRTHNLFLHHANKAVEGNVPVKGVKGPSILMMLDGFDMTDGFVVDNLHCADLGVARQLTTLWLDSKHHEEDWYVGLQIADIDSKIKTIFPPNEISRLPRSVTERKYWKGAEWNNWVFLYSIPTLSGILRADYLKHFCLFIEGMYLLNQRTITADQLNRAENCLNKFVCEFEAFYRVENMTYNVHQLVHMSQCVRNWGPLWCYSTYIFEGYIQDIIHMYHGTQAVPMQIANTFNLWRNLSVIAIDLTNLPGTAFMVKDYLFKNILSSSVNINAGEDQIKLIGSGKQHVLDIEEKYLIEQFLNYEIMQECRSYPKAKIHGNLYTTDKYRKCRRVNNIVTSVDDDLVILLHSFNEITDETGRTVVIFIGSELIFGNNIIPRDRQIGIICDHVQKVMMTGHKIVRYAHQISNKCTVVYRGDQIAYCCRHPNLFYQT